jgi:diketogulonate reductase-like aldo/keto reductase
VFEAVKAAGLARSIGVSNFQRQHPEAVVDFQVVHRDTRVEPARAPPIFRRAGGFVPRMREKEIDASSFRTLAPITVAAGAPLDPVPASTAAK